MRPAAFLDRDGVLNDLIIDRASGAGESPLRVEDVSLMPGAPAALARLIEAGFMLVCVSNQPAAAKGQVSVGRLLAVHERVISLLAEQGIPFAAWCLCLHHPHGVLSQLAGPCSCRKPAPGMLLGAAVALGIDLAGSWMVGDTDGDIGAGRAAGCRTLLIRHPASVHKRTRGVSPDVAAGSLAEGVSDFLGGRSETIATSPGSYGDAAVGGHHARSDFDTDIR